MSTPAAAVAYARAQLGKPYRFGAAGPGAFDCSGLTMRAWQAAGLNLPHFTVAQYAATHHRPIAKAEPGDLVFWNDGGFIHHVALYVGGGKVIEAPRSGVPVRARSISATESGIMPNVGAFPAAAGGQVAGGATAGAVPAASIPVPIVPGLSVPLPHHPSALLPWNWAESLSDAEASAVEAVTTFGLKATFILGGVALVVIGLVKAASGSLPSPTSALPTL